MRYFLTATDIDPPDSVLYEAVATLSSAEADVKDRS
jgi:hypothetical protein